ncbi:MAG: zinc ABC transporter substrate-binding protein [Planctomyces sp.]|nr:zinc ABC transporter substrate-binding protein [Planctomyces sp.]
MRSSVSLKFITRFGPFIAVILVALISSFTSGCSDSPTQDSANPQANDTSKGSTRIRVVATTGMVADIVRAVGGDRVDIQQLMGPGVDPHLYKATRDDVLALRKAHVVFYSGLMLEGRLTDTLNRMSGEVKAVAVTSAIPVQSLLNHGGADTHSDPHVWMDPSLWSLCIDPVLKELVRLSPGDSSFFEKNANNYREELQQLFEYGKKSSGTIPSARRLLISSHDAFSYFGRAFEIEVMAIQGLSTESEASLQRINELVEIISSRKISAVFVESSVPSKNIQALIDGAASRGHTVSIGGELYSDAMGPSNTYEGTYPGMMDHNITLITRGLGGQADPNGMNGKLTNSAEPQKSSE